MGAWNKGQLLKGSMVEKRLKTSVSTASFLLKYNENHKCKPMDNTKGMCAALKSDFVL